MSKEKDNNPRKKTGFKKAGAVIQARMSSSRLPGKVLADIEGKPMIVRLVEQVSHARLLDEIIVATSTDPSDDLLAETCDQFGIACFRGDLENVLERYISVAELKDLDVIIRITGDNPFADPILIDELLEMYAGDSQLDYINNAHRDGSVAGSGAELVTRDALHKADKLVDASKDPKSYREHVTLFIRLNTDCFNTRKFHPPKALSRSDISYTVDYAEDLELVRKIFNALQRDHLPIKTSEIIHLLDKNPDLIKVNEKVKSKLPDF